MFNVSCRYDLFDTRSSFQLAALKFNKVGTAVLSSLFLRWKRMEKHYIHLPKIQFYHKILYQKKLKSQPYRPIPRSRSKAAFGIFYFCLNLNFEKNNTSQAKCRKTKKTRENLGFFDRHFLRPEHLEAPSRIELEMAILQTAALPLGYGAVFSWFIVFIGYMEYA